MSTTRPPGRGAPDPDAPTPGPHPHDLHPTDLHRLSGSIDRLTAHAGDWTTRRLLDEGLDLVRDASWADSCALLRVHRGVVSTVHSRPGLPGGEATTGSSGSTRRHGPGPEALAVPVPPVARSVPVAWFPWGLAPIDADRFVLVDDARNLPATPDGGPTLGSIGIRSCLHLPLRQKGRTVGAVHLFWSEPRLAWDDDRGRLLRTLGRFLLSCGDPVAV